MTSIDHYTADVTGPNSAFTEVPGQTLLSNRWTGHLANGLHLQSMATDTRDALKWPDGTVAVGDRPLGAGRIVTLGAKFAGQVIWSGGTPDTLAMFNEELLAGAGVPKVQGDAVVTGTTTPLGDASRFRHSVANNGLFDVWTITGPGTGAQVADLEVRTSTLPTQALDVLTQTKVPLTARAGAAVLPQLHLGTYDTRVYLTAHSDIAHAPLSWFDLQRGWWQGVTTPRAQPYAAAWPNTVAFGPKYPIGLDTPSTGFTANVTVPQTPAGTTTELWMQEWADATFFSAAQVSIDGVLLSSTSSAGLKGVDATTKLAAGSHSISVQLAASTSKFSGVRGQSWLTLVPPSLGTVDLTGAWTTSLDGFAWNGSTTLPGTWGNAGAGIHAARRSVTVPAGWAGKRVVFSARSSSASTGMSDVFVNGHWYPGNAAWASSSRLDVDITDAILVGQTNTIELHSFAGAPYVSGQAITGIELIERAP